MSHLPRRRLLALLLAIAGLALVSPRSSARSFQVQEPHVEPASVPTSFHGRVFDTHGRPAGGAVVVSSAGGKAAVAADGTFELEVALPVAAESVRVTAVSGSGAARAVASCSVPVRAAGGVHGTGTLTLTEGAGCAPGWLPSFGPPPGSDASVRAFAVWDDGLGGGPALYVGGNFTVVAGVPVQFVAKWDGVDWSPLGEGVNLSVRSLVVFDDGLGGGPVLYAGGAFTEAGGLTANRVARWDGVSWTAVGSGVDGNVRVLYVFDDGSGDALYVGGNFSSSGAVPVNSLARWNGISWSALGSGFDTQVFALTSFDDGSGSGEQLYAGGNFSTADGVAANALARWDGAAWTSVGGGVSGGSPTGVNALAVYDDGSGPDLYVGGEFASAGGVAAANVARWDGAAWSAVSGGADARVRALRVHDDGSGPALYAGGDFTTIGGVAAGRSARFDGAGWTPLSLGMNDSVHVFGAYDSGAGTQLWAGGELTTADGRTAWRLALWDGTEWSPLSLGVSGPVAYLAVYDDGQGPALYAGGFLSTGGGVSWNGVAKWDGTSWSSLGGGFGFGVDALGVYDDGSGPGLYVGGQFHSAGGVPASNVARWDGSTWSALGAGIDGGSVLSFAVYDDGLGGGPALIAGGWFTTAGGLPANGIARWDGSTWSALGSGVTGSLGSFAHVAALEVYGSKLYAGGRFDSIGGVANTCNIGSWDGTAWSSVNGGATGSFSRVQSLAVYDGGSGPELVVGGSFWMLGAVPVSNVGKWNGSNWSPLGSGVNANVYAFEVYDDGSGPALFAAGQFTVAGGVAAARAARWDGTAWTPLGGGMATLGTVLQVFDEGTGLGPVLFTGTYGEIFDTGDFHLGRWGGCAGPRPGIYCTGKTSSAGCVPFLTFQGTPSATSTGTFRVTANDVVPAEAGFLLYASKKGNLNFHGGKLCVKAPIVRTPAKGAISAGAGCSGWVLRRDFNATIQSGNDPALSVGATVFAQWRQRDPLDPAGFGDGLSDGLRFAIAP